MNETQYRDQLSNLKARLVAETRLGTQVLAESLHCLAALLDALNPQEDWRKNGRWKPEQIRSIMRMVNHRAGEGQAMPSHGVKTTLHEKFGIVRVPLHEHVPAPVASVMPSYVWFQIYDQVVWSTQGIGRWVSPAQFIQDETFCPSDVTGKDLLDWILKDEVANEDVH